MNETMQVSEILKAPTFSRTMRPIWTTHLTRRSTHKHTSAMLLAIVLGSVLTRVVGSIPGSGLKGFDGVRTKESIN